MRYVTKDEMREIDRIAIEERGIPAVALMENAGRAVAEECAKLLRKGRIVVFSGYGNNGGDGFVAARYLSKKGYEVSVFLAGRPRTLSPEANKKLEELISAGTTPTAISDKKALDAIFRDMGSPDLVIDAIFGIGVRGPLEDLYVDLIERINALDSPVVAIDIPSGLDADTGRPLPKAIKASITVAIGYPKKGFECPEAREYVGRLFIADIGLRSGVKVKEKTIALRTGKAGRLRPGHPWIYKSQIRKFDGSIRPGDIVKVISAEGKFIGRGYLNPASEISARLLTFKDEAVDDEFFSDKITLATEKRKGLAGVTNAYRAVFSESDGLPGLIVDVYADTAVFQVLTLGMEKVKSVIVEGIRQSLRPKYIYEKSESAFRKVEGLKDAVRWWGEKGKGEVGIFEGKARFLVDVEKGHKTGFYLDQRRSRMAIGALATGKKVLDLFCYTGGFSMHAALGGASSVIGVDIKEEWLDLARKNAALNNAAGRADFVKADVFDFLRNSYNSGERFDIIVVDPPSFAKAKGQVAGAMKGYKELNYTAMKSLNDGGTLCTFSCSHHVPNEMFSNVIKRAARDARKAITVLKRCHQDVDHPIVRSIPETEYLKGYFLKVEPV